MRKIAITLGVFICFLLCGSAEAFVCPIGGHPDATITLIPWYAPVSSVEITMAPSEIVDQSMIVYQCAESEKITMHSPGFGSISGHTAAESVITVQIYDINQGPLLTSVTLPGGFSNFYTQLFENMSDFNGSTSKYRYSQAYPIGENILGLFAN